MPLTRFTPDEILQIAERIEANGGQFYRRAAAERDHPEVRALLLELAEMEAGHERLFAEMRADLTPGERYQPLADPGEESAIYLKATADSHVFNLEGDAGVRLRGDEGAVELLELALRFEKDTIAFFQSLRQVVREADRPRIEELVREEIGHVTRLGRALAELRRPAPGASRPPAEEPASPAADLGQALRAAVELEREVRGLYLRAADQASNAVGRRVFGLLAREEQDHLEYLRRRLTEWETDGTVQPQELATSLPPWRSIESGTARMERTPPGAKLAGEIELLQAAYEVETRTVEFYRTSAAALTGRDAGLFARFVAVEENHLALVKAHMDSVVGLGFWFDFQEFDLAVEP